MSENQLISEMLSKKTWAVVGVSPNPDKVSNHIFKNLQRENYEVYAVNPNYDTIEEGVPCYHSIRDLPVIPDCIDFVVPPAVTLSNLKALDPETYPYVWFQPGTFDDAVVSYAEEQGFRSVHDGSCVMVALRLRAPSSGA